MEDSYTNPLAARVQLMEAARQFSASSSAFENLKKQFDSNRMWRNPFARIPSNPPPGALSFAEFKEQERRKRWQEWHEWCLRPVASRFNDREEKKPPFPFDLDFSINPELENAYLDYLKDYQEPERGSVEAFKALQKKIELSKSIAAREYLDAEEYLDVVELWTLYLPPLAECHDVEEAVKLLPSRLRQVWTKHKNKFFKNNKIVLNQPIPFKPKPAPTPPPQPQMMSDKQINQERARRAGIESGEKRNGGKQARFRAAYLRARDAGKVKSKADFVRKRHAEFKLKPSSADQVLKGDWWEKEARAWMAKNGSQNGE